MVTKPTIRVPERYARAGSAHVRRCLGGSLLLTLLLLAGCREPQPAAPVPEVGVMQPQRRDVVVERDFIGNVQATDEAEIRSKVSGRVVSLEFVEGALVKQGQPLFRIDSDALQTSVNETRSGVAQAQVTLDQLNADEARFRTLVDKGTIARRQYDEVVTRQAQAAAALQAARAQLEQAETMLRESAIVSPYNGRIGRAMVKVGALVSANQTLLATVSTTDSARVDFALSERDYLLLVRPHLERAASDRSAGPVTTRLLLADGSLYGHEGQVVFGDRALSSETGTFALSASFPNPHEVLRPGMFARVRIVVAQLPQALLLPQRAVQQVLDRNFVSVVDGGGKVVRQAVTLGARIGNEVVITAGLDDTARVIVDGHHKVRPGSTVRTVAVDPDTTATPAG